MPTGAPPRQMPTRWVGAKPLSSTCRPRRSESASSSSAVMKIFASSLMPAGLIARAAAGKRSAGGVAPADQRAVLCVDTGAGAREARAFEHPLRGDVVRSEEHTSELQSLMRISYAVFCLKKKKNTTKTHHQT